jgi:hypothetical protein
VPLRAKDLIPRTAAHPACSAEEEYGFTAIRTGVYFLWWQEKDAAVVTQVVDFEKGLVHTTYTSPDRKLSAFQGTVKPPS